jgi:hypothetical protein
MSGRPARPPPLLAAGNEPAGLPVRRTLWRLDLVTAAFESALRDGVGIDPAPHAELISESVAAIAWAMMRPEHLPGDLPGQFELGLALEHWCVRFHADRAEHIDDDVICRVREMLTGGKKKTGRGRPKNRKATIVAGVITLTMQEFGVTREHRIVRPLVKKVFDLLAIKANAKAAIQAIQGI